MAKERAHGGSRHDRSARKETGVGSRGVSIFEGRRLLPYRRQDELPRRWRCRAEDRGDRGGSFCCSTVGGVPGRSWRHVDELGWFDGHETNLGQAREVGGLLDHYRRSKSGTGDLRSSIESWSAYVLACSGICVELRE